MEPKAEVRQFVQELLSRKGDRQAFSDSDSLLLAGRLESVDAVDIVVFLEEKFHIDFAEIGFDQALIDSVDAIDSLIQTVKK
jgi:acyl carrier protein